MHELDHVAAGLIWRDLLEHLPLADQSADSHWPEHLVPAESVEVDAERIERNRKVGSALRTVANENRVRLLPHQSPDLGDGIDRADCVRDMIERDDLRPLVEHCAQEVEIDLPVRSQLADSELRALSHGEHLPGDEIRVVIQCGDDDLVATRYVRESP